MASTARSGCRSCSVPRIATTCSGVLPAPYTTSASPVRAARSTSTRAKPRSSVRGSTGSCCTPGIYRPCRSPQVGRRVTARLRSGPTASGAAAPTGVAGSYLGRLTMTHVCSAPSRRRCSPSPPPCRPWPSPARRTRPHAPSDPDVVAHRGSSGAAPENTIAAIKLALEHRSDTVENDIQRTSDGELVIMHDTTLTRTTDVEEVFPDRAPWNVADFTLAEIKRLDAGSWFAPEFAGQRVPTLEQWVKAVGRPRRDAARAEGAGALPRHRAGPRQGAAARCPTSTGRCAPARSPCSRSTTSG